MLASKNTVALIPHTRHVNYGAVWHVPADVMTRLLHERPAIVGLAVPGMPVGSPGMDIPGHPAERYNILAFDRKGKTDIFASR